VTRARDSQGARARWIPGGLCVKGHSRSFDTVPFNRSHTISYWPSMCSYLVGLQFLRYSEIGLLVESRSFSDPQYLALPFKVTPMEVPGTLWSHAMLKIATEVVLNIK